MAMTIHELRSRKQERKMALESNLRTIQAQLEGMGALRIILFGSLAEGNVRSGSDLDILCVMPSSRTGREWMSKIYGEVDRRVDCDILAYTQEELDETFPVSRFLRHAMENGRVIYDRRAAG
jgi:predicted nucleotidyltransferase